MSTAIEQNMLKAYQGQAYQLVREEYGKYFEALEKHPRLLVGQEVPAIGKEGMERLKDSSDAKEWQEAIKGVLVQEIQARANEQMGHNRNILETLHSAVELFKSNTDLIPGTKGFDRELADKFASIAKPYEVRSNGKLSGYSIPVQPIIDGLRQELAANRTSRPAPAAAPPPPSEPPQAGIPSKAGSSTEKEDFSTLFGTIGLPHLQI
jgi:hypothetical protein